MKTLTQDTLKSLLDYNAETGWFRWRVNYGNRLPGALAGYLHPRGYTRIRVFKRTFDAHRLAWFYVYGVWPKDEIDHINRVKNDNRIVNLRCVSRSANIQNSSLRRDNTSGVKGVCWHTHSGKWAARITVNHKRMQLGVFDKLEDAVKARKDAEIKYHPYRIL